MGKFPGSFPTDNEHLRSHQERQLSWESGSVRLLKVARTSWRRKSVRSDLSIGIKISAAPRSHIVWHINGELKKIWPTSSHDLVVLPPGCEFEAEYSGTTEELWIFVDPESINDECLKSFKSNTAINWNWSKDRLLWLIVSEIRKDCLLEFPRGEVFLEGAAKVFIAQLAHVLNDCGDTRKQLLPLSDTKIKIVIDYIDIHLERNIALAEVAALVNLTPRYLCEAFRLAVGRPPHQFQIERRVERSKLLLCDPDLPLSHVAFTLGFSSQSHFNDCFRRNTGVTPASFRAAKLLQHTQTEEHIIEANTGTANRITNGGASITH